MNHCILRFILYATIIGTLTSAFVVAGASDIPFANEPFDVNNIPEPVPPPKEVRDFFELSDFWQQWINIEGFPVLGSAAANPYAVKELAWQIGQMFRGKTELLKELAKIGETYTVIAYNEVFGDIPEMHQLPRPSLLFYHNVRAGGGWSPRLGSSEVSIFRSASTPIHELAHSIHLLVLNQRDSTFDNHLKKLYDAVVAKDLWYGAAVNYKEYWAEAVTVWFHVPQISPLKTREDLKAYDPDVARLVAEVFGDNDWRDTPIRTRTHLPHLQGFDPQSAPLDRELPPGVEEAYEELRDPSISERDEWVNLPAYDPSMLPRLNELRNRNQADRYSVGWTDMLVVNMIDAQILLYWVNPDGTETLNYRFHPKPWAIYHAIPGPRVGDLLLAKDNTGRPLAVFQAVEKVGRVLLTPTLYSVETDVNSDGVVNLFDLTSVASHFGSRGKSKADVNGDGVIDIVDLLWVAAAPTSSLSQQAVETRQAVETLTVTEVQKWLTGVKQLHVEDGILKNGIIVLEQLLAILTHQGHTNHVWSVAFSPDGSMLASGSWDKTVRLWDVATEQLLFTLFGHTDSVMSVAFSPDGQTLAVGSWDGTIRLWNPHTGTLKRTLTDLAGIVTSVAFSPDGRFLASGGSTPLLQLWNTTTWQIERPLTGHTDVVEVVVFSPDGAILASGSRDKTIRLWNLHTRQLLHTLTEHRSEVNRLAFSPDGSTLASGSWDKVIRLWNPHTGQLKRTLPNQGGWVNAVAFSPDGATLVIGNRGISLWDIETAQYEKPLIEDIGNAISVVFSPDGQTLASGSGSESSDNLVRLWDITLPPLAEYLWSIPSGTSLIHVPLKVTAVDGVAKSITTISDLYATLGGASTVNFLITYDSQTQDFRTYFGVSDSGTSADVDLTDDTGVIAGMKTPVSVRLTGEALGIDGNSTMTLHQGLNLVGLPLNDSNLARVSDLFALDGIQSNVPVVILTEAGDFQSVGQAGDLWDIPIRGGQGFILTAQQPATVTISGEAWSNVTDAASPIAHKRIEVRDTTAVLALRGAVVDEETDVTEAGFRVTAKNLSTGRTVAGMTEDEEVGYRLAVVDIETGRAATIGDTLEITAQSPNPFIGVKPVRYTVTADDVKQSLIQLPELVVYEIPRETELLANYPNPFNPETWIPYRLAADAFVTLTIYDGTGHIVRTLDVGHRIAAVYKDRSKAIYWDGRNDLGESVASGVYFYQLQAGDYSAVRKLVILK